MKTTFDEILKQKELIILDGASATELETRGLDLNSDLWSSKVLIENPEAIKQIHYDYFKSGADEGTTVSYQASIPKFMEKGYTEEEASEFIARSVELLLEARTEWWEKEGAEAGRVFPIAVAAIGPYGAYLADGSEYTGNYKGVTDEQLKDFHRKRMEILKNAGAEMFGVETFPSLHEAVLCAEIMEELDMDYFICFSFKDEISSNGGSTIPECVEALSGYPHLKAIGANCTHPKYIAEITRRFKAVTDIPVVVYPNRGEDYDAVNKVWRNAKDNKPYGEWAKDYYDAGARVIGGCCRTTPEDIKEVYNFSLGLKEN